MCSTMSPEDSWQHNCEFDKPLLAKRATLMAAPSENAGRELACGEIVKEEANGLVSTALYRLLQARDATWEGSRANLRGHEAKQSIGLKGTLEESWCGEVGTD